MTWQAIPASALPMGDYRHVATFTSDIHQLALDCNADLIRYNDDGLGLANAFFLKQTDAEAYCLIICHEQHPNGLTVEVHLLNRALHPDVLNWDTELQSLLNFLRVSPSSQEWVSPFMV